MRLILALVVLNACATRPTPAKGELWFCRAASEEHEKASHDPEHWATYNGPKHLAIEEALKKCLMRHRDCVIESCTQAPPEEKVAGEIKP